MALTNIFGGDTGGNAQATVALSTSYLGAGNYLVVKGGDVVDFWSDDSAIALTYKMSYDGGTTFSADMPLGAGTVYTARPSKGRTLTLDVKAASGTPNLGGFAY